MSQVRAVPVGMTPGIATARRVRLPRPAIQKKCHRKVAFNLVVFSLLLSTRKPIIDKIDLELAKIFGLSDEETDFIVNYDIKYRKGGADEEE